jgi:hypothetical protein
MNGQEDKEDKKKKREGAKDKRPSRENNNAKWTNTRY